MAFLRTRQYHVRAGKMARLLKSWEDGDHHVPGREGHGDTGQCQARPTRRLSRCGFAASKSEAPREDVTTRSIKRPLEKEGSRPRIPACRPREDGE